jgi:hypothetical protein
MKSYLQVNEPKTNRSGTGDGFVINLVQPHGDPISLTLQVGVEVQLDDETLRVNVLRGFCSIYGCGERDCVLLPNRISEPDSFLVPGWAGQVPVILAITDANGGSRLALMGGNAVSGSTYLDPATSLNTIQAFYLPSVCPSNWEEFLGGTSRTGSFLAAMAAPDTRVLWLAIPVPLRD